MRYIFILLSGILSLGFISNSGFFYKETQIKIQWVEDLKGDFDFRTRWSYPEGVYRNKYGQLSCDGFCPPETDSMKDREGKINPDSLTRFYQLVDTTHKFHSILSEAWCYEWAGTDFIYAKETNRNQIVCSTETNVGTHCSLIFEIDNNFCKAKIELNSVFGPKIITYYCTGGFIKIDKKSWKQDILKAEFSFDFKNTDEPDKKMFWKGKIFTMIKK